LVIASGKDLERSRGRVFRLVSKYKALNNYYGSLEICLYGPLADFNQSVVLAFTNEHRYLASYCCG